MRGSDEIPYVVDVRAVVVWLICWKCLGSGRMLTLAEAEEQHQ